MSKKLDDCMSFAITQFEQEFITNIENGYSLIDKN